jgi:Cu(I)/Ag(I) efflux system membrane protein CusA/SilA
MIGGIFTSFLLELIVYPAVYEIWRWNFDLKRRGLPAAQGFEPASA